MNHDTAHEVLIEAGRRSPAAELVDLWRFRDVGFVLGARDIKIRYKQTIFGVGWAILQPLAALVVFSVIFGRFAGLDSDGVAYPVFAYSGILPWTLVSSIVSGAALSLVANERLITKVYFPRMLIPVSVLGYSLLDFVLALVFAVPILVIYRTPVAGPIWLVPPVVAIMVLCALGCGLFLAALNVKYRDVRHAVPFALQIWMFASPVVYSTTMVPEHLRHFAALNPMYGLIAGFRHCLLGTPIDPLVVTISAITGGLLFVAGLIFFFHVQTHFADIV
jgi:lipopolysaccharide transport system permease protein